MTVRKIPMRKCTGCGGMFPKKELIRVILTPEGATELDKTGRKNGRGAYICNSKECLQKAFKSKGLENSLKHSISAEVKERLLKELENGEEE